MSNTAEFDFVIFGATGFTGKLVASYFFERAPGLRWAIAGRNADRLAAVRAELGLPDDLPLIVAAADDSEALDAMVARTRCVISTVGPFQLYGTPLLKACASAGVDYVDLCGEVPWMRDMILGCEDIAKASGARILFSSGFDSLPFEMGMFYLQSESIARFGRPMNRVRARVRAMNGSFSGGTAESFRATVAAAMESREYIAVLKNPFALVPGFEGPAQPSGMKIAFEADLDAWVAPFLMSPINTRNIHRSNSLLGYRYGRDLVYDEMLIAGPGEAGEAAAAQIVKEDAVLATDAGPKPGEGPSAEERAVSSYDVLLIGSIDGVEKIRTCVKSDLDPGYVSTSRMIVETALCLREAPDVAAGFWTPAAALQDRLLERLRTNAEIIFDVEKV